MWSLWNMAFDVGGETHYLHTSDIYQLQFNHFFYLKKSHHMKCMIGINSKSLNQTVFHIHICNKLPLSAKNPAWFFCLSFCDIYICGFLICFLTEWSPFVYELLQSSKKDNSWCALKFCIVEGSCKLKIVVANVEQESFFLFNRCILHAIFICLHCTRSYLILTINFLEIFILFCFFIYHHWSKYYFIIFFFIYHHWSKYCTVIKLN